MRLFPTKRTKEHSIPVMLTDMYTRTQQDLESTMTRVGSPFWVAPEVLAGKRYCENVDTYSLGIVLFEIAARRRPYYARISEFKKKKGRGMDRILFKDISTGKERPDLEAEPGCEKYGVGLTFKTCESLSYSAIV